MQSRDVSRSGFAIGDWALLDSQSKVLTLAPFFRTAVMASLAVSSIGFSPQVVPHSGVESDCRPSGRVLPPGFLPASAAPGLGVAVAPFDHGVLWGHGVPVRAGLELNWRGSRELDGRGGLRRVADPLMLRIAAGVSDTLASRKVML